MIGALQSIDTFALTKVFTPVAHYIQRKHWIISYELSKFFCEVTSAVVVLSAGYYAFKMQPTFTAFSSLSIFIALMISAAYYYVATQLNSHLKSSEAWRKEPLIAVRAFATVDWYFPICFIFAVIAVVSIPGLFLEQLTVEVAVEVVSEKEKALPKADGSPLLYHIIHIVRDVCEVSALYLLRVRPLPPDSHEQKREDVGFNPI